MAWHHPCKRKIVNFFESGDVIKTHDFDTHNPFITKFKIPTKTVSFRTWKVPKDWTTLNYDSWAFQRNYEKQRKSQVQHCCPSQDLIVRWASNIETALDDSIRECHQLNPIDYPSPSLPKDFKGRCTGKITEQRQPINPPKIAKNGHFEPMSDVVSYQ